MQVDRAPVVRHWSDRPTTCGNSRLPDQRPCPPFARETALAASEISQEAPPRLFAASGCKRTLRKSTLRTVPTADLAGRACLRIPQTRLQPDWGVLLAKICRVRVPSVPEEYRSL